MVANKKNKKQDEGQAIFEFIVFTPFFIAFFVIMINIISTINGSINQQKATRGFFYRTVRGNSTLPLTEDIYIKNTTSPIGGIQEIGAYSIGFQEKADGLTPVAACYKLTKLPGAKYEDTCEEPAGADEPSGYFRVFTVYGVCSNSYTRAQNGNFFYYDYINRGFSSCNIR